MDWTLPANIESAKGQWGNDIGGSTKKSICQVGTEGVGIDLQSFVTANSVTGGDSKVMALNSADVPTSAWVGKICSENYDVTEGSFADSSLAWSETAADSCTGGNAFIYDNESGTCVYSFDGGEVDPLQTQTQNDDGTVTVKEEGFIITYQSNEACATDEARKFTFQIVGKCNKDADPADTLTAISEGTGLSEVIDCAQTQRLESPDACDFFVYGKYVEVGLATLDSFFGVFCIGFGLIIAFAGVKIMDWTRRAILFMVLFGIGYGLAYNLFTLSS